MSAQESRTAPCIETKKTAVARAQTEQLSISWTKQKLPETGESDGYRAIRVHVPRLIYLPMCDMLIFLQLKSGTFPEPSGLRSKG